MPSKTQPNVVIILVDEQKTNSLPLYGNPIVQTPNLEKLASQGAIFNHAYTTTPICVAARVSLMTGRYPHTTGSRTNAVLLQNSEQDLVSLFRAQGYRTGLVGKNHCFQTEALSAFDYVWEAGHQGPVDPPTEEAAAAKQWLIDSQVGRKAWGADRNPYPAEALGTALTTDHAIDFITANQNAPFFLWYSIPDPHTPLQTSSPYAEMYPPESIPLPPFLEDEMATKPPAQQIDYRALAGDTVTDEMIQQALAIYYGMNTYIDDQVGRFLAQLDHLSLRENTLVIYLSDHGDYMGEHRMIRKSKALYDCLCHVPLIVTWPGVINAGERHDAFVCLEDIMPTILGLLGWSVPAGVQGQSFAPLLTGNPYQPRPAIFGEAGVSGPPYAVDDWTTFPAGPLTPDFTPSNKKGGLGLIKSIRTYEWKLVHYPGQPYGELYNLQADPWELHNLYGQPQYQAITDQLRLQLLDWLIDSEDTLPAIDRDIVDG